jgi:hypothetical protein
VLRAAERFQGWLTEQADRWRAPILEAPKDRRDEFGELYFRGAEPDQVVVILKAREPARMMTAIGDRKVNRWPLQIADRWVVQYNFYAKDRRCSFAYAAICRSRPGSVSISITGWELDARGKASTSSNAGMPFCAAAHPSVSRPWPTH